MNSPPVALPAFSDNYIWGMAREGVALVVDPGDAAVVDAWLAREDLVLATILVTHHHADHTAGVAALKTRHGCRVLGPDEDIDGLDAVLRGGETLSLPPFGSTRVLPVPGHTRGHIAYHFPDDRLLFCGDTLFSAGCGRLFEGSAADLYESLRRLSSLPGDTRICCAHEYTAANLRFAAAVEPGNPARATREAEVRTLRAQGRPTLPVTLAQELAYNPFLRWAEPEVMRQAARQAGHELAAGLPVLAALRAWKDVF